MKSNLNFELDGLTQVELERIRAIIDMLFIKKVFFIRNGSARLNFNHKGELAAINFETVWKKEWEDKY